MTEILSGVAHSLFGNPASYQMPDNADQDWRQHYIPHMPLLTSQWAGGTRPPPIMGGMQDVNMGIFQHDTTDSTYIDSYGPGGSHHFSPPVGYNGEGNWHSDVDMGTPSTGPFPASMGESYHPIHAGHSNHLQLPQRDHLGGTSLHSPRSSRGAISPGSHISHPPSTSHTEERPPLGRSNTAPDHPGHRRSTTSTGTAGIVKRSGSEEGEDEYVPTEEHQKSGRGRKRQRVPHTAVERRYRENLNAHLDKLRQTVPAFAKRRASGSGKPGDPATMGEGVKPSKCEILNGAIEHILAVDKENAALKHEVQALRARLDELERWYGTSQGAAFTGA
ncbi:Hypothetical protein R9X50_00380900 [Acrodontium crateriforme]|uniref:BHLH domain-containing protein n=1 Tax=Acrodontium crateriforme TaxID=150365 RepID=A0AAQ3RA68_9PEZI|nr:Hypothetical protein R9X50_00380900 [Acrodontium crateriforme]